MQNNLENDNKSRRKFLDKGLKIGVLAAAGSVALAKVFGYRLDEGAEETVELMSTDGTLM